MGKGEGDQLELLRRLTLFDVTMLVMGGIVGAGIFINPYVVAQQVGTPALVLAAWLIGGVIALAGAFIWAELAAIRPLTGGQYAYLREGIHPLAAFLYGWTLLLVVQGGGMAAVAVTFAVYFKELTGVGLGQGAIAAFALASLAAINCLGVRAGSNLQNVFMVLKTLAILVLIGAGLFLFDRSMAPMEPVLDRPVSLGLLAAMGSAMVPVLFSFGGWQTTSFVTGEVKDPTRSLPLGLMFGVIGVVLLYLGVNWVCLRVLGLDRLAATTTPASAVMTETLGSAGGRLIAAGIAVSTFGFLGQNMLVAPRVYYAMARDGLFFASVGRLHAKTRVPVLAIVIQATLASIIALSGRYEQILNYVVSTDWIFFGLTACCLLVFRRRDESTGEPRASYRMPGHPWTTVVFVTVSFAVVLNTIYRYPGDTGIGMLILAVGVPVYFFWKRKSATAGAGARAGA